MRFAVVIIIFLLPAIGCKRDIEIVEVLDADTGATEVFERSKTTGQREGFYRMTNAQGILIEEAEYKHDVLHGRRKLYDEQGKLIREETHENGLYHGPMRSFYPDGKVDAEGEYIANEMTGTWLRYYPSGQLMESVTFKGNLENGPFTEYHPNGKRKAEGHYLEGNNEHGELLEYDTLGVLITRKLCTRGICKTTWSKENQ